MQLSVLDYRTLWPYFDPSQYPPPITTDIRSNAEIFYTFREMVPAPVVQWPYSKTDYSKLLPATPQDTVSELTLYCDWNTNDRFGLLVGSQVAYSQGGTTPYSGFLQKGQPPQNPPVGRPTSNPHGLYDLFYLEPVRPTAANPIVAVQAVYESTGGVYCAAFTFADGTSSGQIPNQAGLKQKYPNQISITPPAGYKLSSFYTLGGGYYYSVEDVVVGFRMRI